MIQEEAKSTVEKDLETAQDLLSHYFQIAGVKTDVNDVQAELEELVELIFEAGAKYTELRIQQALEEQPRASRSVPAEEVPRFIQLGRHVVNTDKISKIIWPTVEERDQGKHVTIYLTTRDERDQPVSLIVSPLSTEDYHLRNLFGVELPEPSQAKRVEPLEPSN